MLSIYQARSDFAELDDIIFEASSETYFCMIEIFMYILVLLP